MSAIAGVLVILRLKMSGCGGKNILYVIQQHPDNTKHWLSKSVFTVQRRHTDTLGITDSRKTPQEPEKKHADRCQTSVHLGYESVCKVFDLQNPWSQFSSVLFAPSTFLSFNQVTVKTDQNVCQELLFLFVFRNENRFFLSLSRPCLIRKTRSRHPFWQQKKKHLCCFYLLSSIKAAWDRGSNDTGKDDATCMREQTNKCFLWISLTEHHSWKTGAECGFGIKGSQSGQLWRRLALE